MTTQEDRIARLEQTTQEYRPVLQSFAYELTMIKGLIVEHTSATHELRQDMIDVNKRLDRLETKVDEHTTILVKQTSLLTQILERLPKQ